MLTRQLALAIGLGVTASLFGGRWGWNKFVSGPLEKREKALAGAESKRATTQRKVNAARLARLDFEEYSARALPSDPAKAQERFQAYLIEILQEAGIQNPSITPGQPAARDGVTVIPFTVQATAEMSALVAFLHRFYQSARFQQIRRLSLNPIAEAGKRPALRIALSVEALAFGSDDETASTRTDGESAGSPSEQDVPRRVTEDLSAYADIARRNMILPGGAGSVGWSADSPENVVFAGSFHRDKRAEADLFDQAVNRSHRVAEGARFSIGGTEAKLVDLGQRDAVLVIDGELWRWTLGSAFSQRTPLTVEQALAREVDSR